MLQLCRMRTRHPAMRLIRIAAIGSMSPLILLDSGSVIGVTCLCYSSDARQALAVCKQRPRFLGPFAEVGGLVAPVTRWGFAH